MRDFAKACARRPFANGTEGEAWMSAWCHYCVRDHDMHQGGDGPGCDLIAAVYIGEWPEGWVPEPDDGQFFLPSRIVCTAFAPCEPCGGDPGTTERSERIADVIAYWKEDRS